MQEVLGTDHWAFRSAGPAWFFVLMRSVAGWVNSIKTLDCSVDLRKIGMIFPQIQADDPHSSYSTSFGTEESRSPEKRLLKVAVKENGTSIVELELPVRAISDLEDLLPEKAKNLVQKNGISLRVIKEKVIQSEFQPQEVFSLESESRSYRVWIE